MQDFRLFRTELTASQVHLVAQGLDGFSCDTPGSEPCVRSRLGPSSDSDTDIAGRVGTLHDGTSARPPKPDVRFALEGTLEAQNAPMMRCGGIGIPLLSDLVPWPSCGLVGGP